MGAMASQITSLTIVYLTVNSRNIKALRHWSLCGEFTVTGDFRAQLASNAENVPFDDVMLGEWCCWKIQD